MPRRNPSGDTVMKIIKAALALCLWLVPSVMVAQKPTSVRITTVDMVDSVKITVSWPKLTNYNTYDVLTFSNPRLFETEQLRIVTGTSWSLFIPKSKLVDGLKFYASVRASSTPTYGSITYTPVVTPPPDTVIVTPPPTDTVVTPPPVVVPPFDGSLPPHPRVWMDASRITHLKAQRAANAVRWTRVLAAADGQVGRTTFNIVDLDKVPDLCLVYLATDDVRYAQRVGVILTAYATEANNLTGDSGYGVRFNLPLVTMGLDWCYNGLTVAQRRQAATWLMNRADWVWPESNPARLNAHGTNNPAINYYWGFMMTGPAALAAHGDDTGTGTVSGADRAKFHTNLVLSRWNGQVATFFAGEGAGGAWADGTGYDSAWRLGAFTDAFFTAGKPTPHPFLAQSLAWRLHSTTPGNRFKVPFGMQPRSSDGALFTYDRLSALYPLASSGASSALRANVFAWLDAIGQVPVSEFNATATLADELLRYTPDSSVLPTALPKGFAALGPGHVVYRQNWTDPNATLLAFTSGPVADGGAREANGLMIWKGGFWISANANIYSASGVETASSNYNTLTVGGVGQQLYGGNTGVFSGPIFSDTLVRFGGQAKNTYGYQNQWNNTRFVDDYTREVAYFPTQDIIVVVDRATAKVATAAKVWRWHSKNPATINGNTFILSNPAGDQRCHVTVNHPTATLANETVALGAGGLLSSHAVSVTMSGQATDVVVTVFQCNGQTPLVPQITTGQQVTVTIAGRTIVLPGAAGVVVPPTEPPATPTVATITLDTLVRFQTISGWEASAQNGHDSPGFAGWRESVLDSAAAIGLTRLRIEVNSGTENSIDYWSEWMAGRITRDEWRAKRYTPTNDNADPLTANPAGFHFAKLDSQIDGNVTPMRARVPGLKVTLTYVNFGGNQFHPQSPQEYAELLLVTFQHIQSKYGWVPDAVEVVLEPDNGTGWTATQMGNAIVAAGSRLAAAGFTPEFITPSTMNMSVAITWLNGILAVPGASTYVKELSYHRYAGVSDASLVAIASRAAQLNIRTAMLEHIGSGVDALYADLTLGNVSSWQQYTVAFPTADDGAQLFPITNGIVTTGSRTHGLRPYFTTVRPGAIRVKATSDNGVVRTTGFINSNGWPVAVLHTSAAGNYVVRGVRPGRYTTVTSNPATPSLGIITADGTGTLRFSTTTSGIVALRGIP